MLATPVMMQLPTNPLLMEPIMTRPMSTMGLMEPTPIMDPRTAIRMMAMMNNNNSSSNSNSNTTTSRAVTPPPKKSVRFNEVVEVACFEKVSREEVSSVWFEPSQLDAIKCETRTMASVYRKLCDIVVGSGSRQHPLAFSEYRGVENRTVTRQRRRLVANTAAITAHRSGATDEVISELYRAVNGWSKEVAYAQAICDYAESVRSSSNNIDEEPALKLLPSVSSMVPPEFPPVAVECAKMYRREKKRAAYEAEQQQLARLVKRQRLS